MRTELRVDGANCPLCLNDLIDRLRSVDGVNSVDEFDQRRLHRHRPRKPRPGRPRRLDRHVTPRHRSGLERRSGDVHRQPCRLGPARLRHDFADGLRRRPRPTAQDSRPSPMHSPGCACCRRLHSRLLRDRPGRPRLPRLQPHDAPDRRASRPHDPVRGRHQPATIKTSSSPSNALADARAPAAPRTDQPPHPKTPPCCGNLPTPHTDRRTSRGGQLA